MPDPVSSSPLSLHCTYLTTNKKIKIIKIKIIIINNKKKNYTTTQHTKKSSEVMVRDLQAMGLGSESSCRRAVAAAFGDINTAVEYLMSGIPPDLRDIAEQAEQVHSMRSQQQQQQQQQRQWQRRQQREMRRQERGGIGPIGSVGGAGFGGLGRRRGGGGGGGGGGRGGANQAEVQGPVWAVDGAMFDGVKYSRQIKPYGDEKEQGGGGDGGGGGRGEVNEKERKEGDKEEEEEEEEEVPAPFNPVTEGWVAEVLLPIVTAEFPPDSESNKLKYVKDT